MTKSALTICITTILALSCGNSEEKQTTQKYTHSDNIVALNKSTASLDTMLVTTESMIEDMNKMNRNLEAIFQAVTGCENEEACETLKQKLATEADQQGND
jgi:hypothetical protein